MSGPNFYPYSLLIKVLISTTETIMHVVKISVLPTKKVNENFEIFLTQAIGIKIHIKNPPITSRLTSNPNTDPKTFLAAVEMKETSESENENCVAAIIKSKICFALGPKTFKVIKEYDFISSFFAISTNFNALTH